MVLTCTQQKIHLRKANAAFNLALHSDKPHSYYSDGELKSIFFERKGEKLVEVWDNVAEEKNLQNAYKLILNDQGSYNS